MTTRRVSTYAGAGLAGDWSGELPGTGVELILELDGTWELDLAGRRASVGAFAAGLLAAPVRTRSAGAVRLVQVDLDPLDVPALLGVPAGELAGVAAPLDALLGRRGTELLERLDGAGDPVAVASAWASATLGRAADAGPAAPTPFVPADVRRATARLRASGGTLAIGELAAELGCTRRHLARRFAEWVGVTPAEYRRLVRFERAIAALRSDPTRPLGPLALDLGYADHAHLDRDFRAFAGAPPSAVAPRLG